jgi:hypothetical protein
MLDLKIIGRWGLYSILPKTRVAERWLRANCPPPRASLHGALVCEGGDRCRDIVRGAVADGLRVEVNGVDMVGFAWAAPMSRVEGSSEAGSRGFPCPRGPT